MWKPIQPSRFDWGDAGRRALGWAGENLVPIATGVTGYVGQQQTNAANARQAREQMEFQERMAIRQEGFQERMSNTAVRRHVEDLRAAGLNPALAFSSAGASTPAGSMASGAMAHMEDAAAKGVASAQAAKRHELENRLLASENVKTFSEGQRANTDMLIARDTMNETKRRIAAEAASAEQANETSKALEQLYQAQRANEVNAGAKLQAEARMYRSSFGGAVLPWLNAALPAARTVIGR